MWTWVLHQPVTHYKSRFSYAHFSYPNHDRASSWIWSVLLRMNNKGCVTTRAEPITRLWATWPGCASSTLLSPLIPPPLSTVFIGQWFWVWVFPLHPFISWFYCCLSSNCTGLTTCSTQFVRNILYLCQRILEATNQDGEVGASTDGVKFNVRFHQVRALHNDSFTGGEIKVYTCAIAFALLAVTAFQL